MKKAVTIFPNPKMRASCCSAVSRIWLVLVNTVFLGISLLSFVVGSGILSLRNPDLQFNGIMLIVFGVFFLITALSGCCGSLCRLVSFLTFYIVAVSINLLLLGVGGVFSLVQTIQRKNSWAKMTLDDWKKLSDREKDFAQQAFRCCGFSKGDEYQYTGKSFKFWNQPNDPVNLCVLGNKLDGCLASGNAMYEYFVRIIAVAIVVGIVTCIISIMAASAARRRRALVENGFLRSKSYRNDPAYTPLK